METENIENNYKEESNASSSALDAIGDVLTEIPFRIGGRIVSNASEILSTVKDSVEEHSTSLLEGAAETAGDIAGGIVNIISGAIDNIDL